MLNATYDDQDQEARKDSIEPSLEVPKSSEEQAEIDKLNDDFNSPSATGDFRPKKPKLGNDESESTEPPAEKDLFKPTGMPQTKPGVSSLINQAGNWIKGNPKKATGGGLGIAGIIALIFIIAGSIGPMQFVHLSQMMDAIHFSDSETTSNNRTRKLVQYIKSKGEVKNTRLGIVGNKIANKTETKLNKSGWFIEIDKTGTYKGMTFDPTKADPPLSEAEAKKQVTAMEEDFKSRGITNIETDPNGSRTTVKPQKGVFSAYFDKKIISMTHANNTEHGKIMGAVQKRLLYKRSGITWNPITKLDNKIKGTVADKLKKWQEERTAQKNAPAPEDVTVKPPNTDENATKEEQAKQTKAGESLVNETNDYKEQAKSKQFSKAGTFGKAAGAAGFASLLCIAQQVAHGADTSKQLATKLPLMKEAAEFIAIGSKVMAGDDIDMEVLGALNDEINSSEGGSWTGANGIQYHQGNETPGTKLPDELNPNPSASEASKFLDSIPGLDGFCGVMNNGFVQVFSLAAGLVTGPIATLASTALMPVVINQIETFFSTDPIDLTKYIGSVKGEVIYAGMALLSNEANGAMGGWKITDAQVAELTEQTNQVKSIDDKNRSIADKYLNPYKYDTATAKIIDNTNTKNLASMIIKVPKNLFSSIPRLFTGNVSAQEAPKYSELNYGMSKIGFPVEALNAETTENPYQNALEVNELVKKDSKLAEKLLKCNNITVTTDPLDFSFAPDSTIPSYEALPAECSDMGDVNFMKLRVAALDTKTLQAYACYEYDDSESCTDITGKQEISDSTTLPAGTEPVGASGWAWPIQDASAIKDGPCYGGSDLHAGMDINVSKSDVPAIAAHDGIVYRVDVYNNNPESMPQGNFVMVKSSDGVYYNYQHLSSIKVKVGDAVTAGQSVIGAVGKTGNVDAPASLGHLHFGVSTGTNFGKYGEVQSSKDPVAYLPKDAPGGYVCIK